MKVLSLFVLIVSWTTALRTENLLVVLNSNPDIVDNETASTQDFQLLVQLWYLNRWICDGSLVSINHVVTAAHCVDFAPTNLDAFSIKAGSKNLSDTGVSRQVSAINLHPHYNAQIRDFDIAVIKLLNSIQGPNIKPILIREEGLEKGQSATVAGWGLTKEDGSVSNTLRFVSVQAIDNTSCNATYDGSITNSMICASGNGTDACQGESGGPLTVSGELVGIVSRGLGCARPEFLSVYSNVPAMRNFITSVTGI